MPPQAGLFGVVHGVHDMKCTQCDHDNPEKSQFCSNCGVDLNTATARRIRRAIKVWLVGGLTGLVTGLSFILVHDALTTDLMFDLWEFAVALATPALIAALVSIATRSRIVILLAIAYLTLLIPVLGASFGASGSEPLWQFAALGLVGGWVWSTPFATWQLTGRR
jgi:hypothetical protein